LNQFRQFWGGKSDPTDPKLGGIWLGTDHPANNTTGNVVDVNYLKFESRADAQ
jgi:hypothetical protein